MSLENPEKIKSQSKKQHSPLGPAIPLLSSYLLPLLLLPIRQTSYHSHPCTC